MLGWGANAWGGNGWGDNPPIQPVLPIVTNPTARVRPIQMFRETTGVIETVPTQSHLYKVQPATTAVRAAAHSRMWKQSTGVERAGHTSGTDQWKER